MTSPRLTQADPPALNEDMLSLVAESNLKHPNQDELFKSKKEEHAVHNVTASAPASPTAAGHYMSEVYEVFELIMTWETNSNDWIDPIALETIKINCLD
ncbi:hypothetical protein KC356_g8499 [Hortaea werneckii]|nr:hypothetical protein KC356_g8499 [Hortaea werneckii]